MTPNNFDPAIIGGARRRPSSILEVVAVNGQGDKLSKSGIKAPIDSQINDHWGRLRSIAVILGSLPTNVGFLARNSMTADQADRCIDI
jgi:hypothetical protein